MNDFDNEILPTDPDEGEEITERVAGRETYEWVRSLVGAVLVITLLFTFVVRLMGVDGHSMVPTLQDGDRLIVVSGWLCGDYKYGDIVIAYKESFDAEPIVKRVIATEGQTVDIDFTLGRVFVDGELLQTRELSIRLSAKKLNFFYPAGALWEMPASADTVCV